MVDSDLCEFMYPLYNHNKLIASMVDQNFSEVRCLQQWWAEKEQATIIVPNKCHSALMGTFHAPQKIYLLGGLHKDLGWAGGTNWVPL